MEGIKEKAITATAVKILAVANDNLKQSHTEFQEVSLDHDWFLPVG